MTDGSAATGGTFGPLERPLAGWGNDDLLLTQTAREQLALHHPEALPIFHWPALAERFASFDPAANSNRRRTRRRGLWAAALGFSGLVLTALTPVFVSDGPEPASRMAWLLGLLAALLAAASGVLGYLSIRKGDAKWRWLASRFWTERMRQLHFQFIANHLDLAARAMSDSASLAAWEAERARALAEFEQRLGRSLADAVQRMIDDLAEEQLWIDEAWARPAPAPPPSPALDTLFAIVRHQRFDIQILYTRLKLHPGITSVRGRSRLVRATSEVLTVASLGLAIAIGLELALGWQPSAFAPRLLVGLAGCATAGVLTLRMLDEGMQLKSETERYEWYLAAVDSTAKQFDLSDPAGKAAALREMERLSYQELRWFMDGFRASRFVM